MKYYVMTKRVKGEQTFNVVETIRTDKNAAENDVSIFKDICRKHAWIEEEKC